MGAITLAVNGLTFLGIEKLGRVRMLKIGTIGMTLSMLFLGVLALTILIPALNFVLIVLYLGCYSFSMGSMKWVYV
jgi:hypothetical protein